jgi:hypothetical protein
MTLLGLGAERRKPFSGFVSLAPKMLPLALTRKIALNYPEVSANPAEPLIVMAGLPPGHQENRQFL